MDLMAGRAVVFPSRAALEAYTRETGRYVPTAEAKKCAGGLARCLLREMPQIEVEDFGEASKAVGDVESLCGEEGETSREIE